MALRALVYALWIGPACVQVCLAVLMWRRKLHATLPVFFAYTVFQVANTALQVFFYHRSQLEYFYYYWTAGVLAIALGFGVIYEIFHQVFRPFVGLKDFGSVLFRWACLVLVLAALLMAAGNPALHPNHVLAFILTLERSIRVMQCGMVLLLLLCSTYLGISWRNHVFGISAGFGIIAALDLIAITILARFGQRAASVYVQVKMAAYLFAVVLWTGYLSQPDPERMEARRLLEADRLDFALASATHGAVEQPSLGLIESAVERVFQKSNGTGEKKPGGPTHADQ